MYKSSMRMFMATSAFAVVVASVAVPIQADAAAKVFKDVPKDHHNYKEISEMASKGIINGYERNEYRPNELISRQHAATLLFRAYKPKSNKSISFTDMPKSNPHSEAMSTAVALRWLEAPNGKSRPNETITRGEMAVAISRAATLTDDVFQEFKLTDVSHKYRYPVDVLLRAGVTTGYTEDNTFRENKGLTRAHYAVFVYRAMDNEKRSKDAYNASPISKTYVGKFTPGEVPVPEKYKHMDKHELTLHQVAEHRASGQRNQSLKPYTMNTLEQIKKATNSSEKEILAAIDKSAKAGEQVALPGKDGKKYYIGYSYYEGNIFQGGGN